MISLKNKKILYIAPKFFGYEKCIHDQLKKYGAEIDYIPDRFFDSPAMAALTKIRREWLMPFINKAYRGMLKGFSRSHYDVVFVVNGQTLSEEFLAELRRQYKQAVFILYMWDSIKNRKSTIKNLESFDYCFSFDKADSAEFSMGFRPLFFSEGFKKCNSEMLKKFDISFVGTAHTDRYHIVKSVSANLPKSVDKYWYLYLQARWVYHFYKATNYYYKDAKSDEFRFSPISKEDVQDIFFSSSAILDVEHPNQSGLTIRTLETIGSEKKLITTNQNVRDYDFFLENNILVIDRKKPFIPNGFIDSPYIPISEEIYHRYSIEGWLDEILLESKITVCT